MRSLRLTIDVDTSLSPADLTKLVSALNYPEISITHVAVDDRGEMPEVERLLRRTVADGQEGIDYTVTALPDGAKIVDIGNGTVIEIPKGDRLMRYLTSQAATANAIGVIFPYWKDGAWVFDDDTPGIGLKAEPFVLGASEALSRLVEMEQIPDAGTGFALYFSDKPFPQYNGALDWVREEHFGNWYRWPEANHELWLCPALFKYFAFAPLKLFVKAEPKKPVGSALPGRHS